MNNTRRGALIAVLGIVGVVATSSAVLHESLLRLFDMVGVILATHPVLGPLVFVLMAAASAMLAFFSSAALVPAGVVTWGMRVTAGLLALGWLAGGLASYSAARWLGRPILKRLSREPSLARYERQLSRETPFFVVFLFQLALPSEIPGYVLGLVRYPIGKYLAALALVELPFAVVTVWLGQEFLQRQVVPFLIALAMVALIGTFALPLLRRRLRSPETR